MNGIPSLKGQEEIVNKSHRRHVTRNGGRERGRCMEKRKVNIKTRRKMKRQTPKTTNKPRPQSCRRRHLLSSAGGTLCIPGHVCLSSRYSLVLMCLVCLKKEEEQLYSFRARWRLRPSSYVSGKPLVFHLIRRPSTTNTIPVPEPTGNCRAFNLIQGSIITIGKKKQ